ncbi:MAG: ABC transporter permease [Mesosutterella sp.]|nr:ABC transporter permease [Mesosutterella sp.]
MPRRLLYLVLPALLFALWEGASHSGRIPAILLPTPESVFAAFCALASDGTLAAHIASSARRAFTGFVLSALLGVGLGVFLAGHENARHAGSLLLEALRVTPPLSLVPLLILWLGIDEAPKVAIVFLASFFPVYMNALSAVRSVDPGLKEVALLLHFSPFERFRCLTLPASLPGILTGLRLGFGYSWRALVGAELIASSSGLGFLISESAELSKTDAIFVGIIMIAVLGVAADAALQALLSLASARIRSGGR